MSTRSLPEPFGSAPRFPGKYEIKFKYRDGKFNCHVFAALYSAKHFLLKAIADRPYKWLDERRIRCEDVRIECAHLEAIVEHEFSPEEAAWVLPIPYAYYAHAIATDEPWGLGTGERIGAVQNTKQEPQAQTSSASRRKKRKSVDVTPKSSSDTPKIRKTISYDGTTFGIHELATTTNADASRVRAALRKSGIEKPQAGWVWPLDQKDTVISTLKKFLK